MRVPIVLINHGKVADDGSHCLAAAVMGLCCLWLAFGKQHHWFVRASPVIAVLATSALANEELDSRFEKDVLLVEASRWACHRFDIYVAITEAQRSRGLMFVRELPARSLFAEPLCGRGAWF